MTTAAGIASTVTVTADTSGTGLIGATVTGVTGITQTNTQVSITLTPAPTVANPNPTPLTPTQSQAAIQTDVNTAVQAAVSSGQLPSGTQAPVVSPVSTGKFSAAGS